MRSWAWSIILASSIASADETITLSMRRSGETRTEPWLHLDATAADPADAKGGLTDGRGVLFELGPRVRLSAAGRWWQTALAPSLFTDDLRSHGWRAGGELSYDLGPFRVGINASMGRDDGATHRMVGLFAYRTFQLSRWMHAWIVLGIALEQRNDPGQQATQGTSIGLMLGTTFR
jgi:hypothetical protein